MSHWEIILRVALVTFLLRASFILFADPRRFPHAFRQALFFVPPAVLASIVAPGLAMPNGVIDVTFANHRWVAGLVALAVAAVIRHPLAAVAVGMPSLWLLDWAMR